MMGEIQKYTDKRLYHFYHCCAINAYETITREHVTNVIESGLYDQLDKMVIGVVGPKINYHKIRDSYKECSLIEVRHLSSNIRTYEFPTLMALQEHAMSHVGYYCYAHTKAVISGSHWWRYDMENSVIRGWGNCVDWLNLGASTCGYWFGPYNIFHYGGNYWWANDEYLKNSPRIHVHSDRMLAERWIGLAGKGAYGFNYSDSRFSVDSVMCVDSDFIAVTYGGPTNRQKVTDYVKQNLMYTPFFLISNPIFLGEHRDIQPLVPKYLRVGYSNPELDTDYPEHHTVMFV